MSQDKFSAVWLSYSSIKDFLHCPRAYYLSNLYKNPRTNRKIGIIKPPLALGQVIHSVIDSLSTMPVSTRFNIPLVNIFNDKWRLVAGKKGGFTDTKQEDEYRLRGIEMLNRITKHPGPLARKAVKINMELPYYWLSEEEELILCGKIDWLEYLIETDSVHIIDFKTGQVDERADSLQLPIYYLLATNCQKRIVSKLSYWYLNKKNIPEEQPMPDQTESYKRVMEIANRIKLARKLSLFKCATNERYGCRWCAPLQAIVDGRSEFVGVGEYNQELYILSDFAASL